MKRFSREAAGCCGLWQAGLWRGEAGQRVQVWTGKASRDEAEWTAGRGEAGKVRIRAKRA